MYFTFWRQAKNIFADKLTEKVNVTNFSTEHVFFYFYLILNSLNDASLFLILKKPHRFAMQAHLALALTLGQKKYFMKSHLNFYPLIFWKLS